MDALMVIFYLIGFVLWTLQMFNLFCETEAGFLTAAGRRRRNRYQLIGIVLFILAGQCF